MNELEALVGQGTELIIDGEPVVIKPLKVGQLPAFLRVISPAMQQLTSADINWLALLGERGDDLLSAIAIAVGKPRAWVNELAADEAVLLAAKVIEVNADFFTRTVMPKLDRVFAGPMTPTAAAAAGSAAVGSTPSNT